MLTKFSVSNFKSFNSEFTFDLTNTNSYAFNKESVKNGIVNNGLIYGHNGVGKSNLGLALFDIIGHLSDKMLREDQYNQSTYLNALNKSKYATFKYEFNFKGDIVHYHYTKSDVRTVVTETLIINEIKVAQIDRTESNEAFINIIGAETLNRNLSNKNLSLLKYIRNNSILKENELNYVLHTFFHFIDRMLFFRSLNMNMFVGLETKGDSIEEDIISKGNLLDLEKFLNQAGIQCNLEVVKELEQDRIAFKFDDKYLSFFDIASTGTKSLILFYFWFQRIRESETVSFLFIDEFDAFYHHSLSALIVEELIKTNVQFILTSHNTSIITNDLLRPDCYFLMNNKSIKSLSNSTPKELREAHNIEKMYKAGTFNV